MKRVLLVLWDGGGVVPPLLSVARDLRARGVEVVVLADPTVEPEAGAAGCAFLPWTTAPHRTSRGREADVLPDWAFASPLAFYLESFRPYWIEAGPRWTADVLGAIDAVRPGLVAHDLPLFWASLAAEARGLPRAVLVTHPNPLPLPGTAPPGADTLPLPAALAPTRDRLLRAALEWVYDRWRAPLNGVRAGLGLPPLAHALDTVRTAEVTLVLGARAFEPPTPNPPANLVWTGPRLDDPAWCEPWAPPWPADDARPLVLVALSSTFQGQVPLLNAAVEALADLDVRAVVTLGPTIQPEEVPPRGDVVVVRSAPHGPLLAGCAAVFTHAGHGTVMKALAAGVPLVCAPMGRDQDDNAARVARLGCGLRVPRTASPARIREALRRVIDEPDFRQAAGRMAAAIARGEGQVDAAAHLIALTR